MIVTMLKTDNIFESEAECIVNPVNCEGVMGAGMALQLSKKYPEVCQAYRTACYLKRVNIGEILFIQADDKRWIANFPTKKYWRLESSYDIILLGLWRLTSNIEHLGLKSIAIPALGCGLGKLKWDKVEPMIKDAFKDLPDILVELYPPGR